MVFKLYEMFKISERNNCYYLVYFKEILRLDDDSSETVGDQQRPQRSSSSRPTLLSEDNRKSVTKIL